MKKALATFLFFAMLLSITACKAKMETSDTPDSIEITAETEITTVTEETTTSETTPPPPPPEPERSVLIDEGAPTIIEFDGVETLRYYHFNKAGRLTGYDTGKANNEGTYLNKEAYNADGTLNYIQECELDEDGNVVKALFYIDGELVQYQVCEYDDDGNMIKHDTLNPDGSVFCSDKSEYDENGNEIKYVYYKDDGSVGYS